jgi:hypothetical protein
MAKANRAYATGSKTRAVSGTAGVACSCQCNCYLVQIMGPTSVAPQWLFACQDSTNVVKLLLSF